MIFDDCLSAVDAKTEKEIVGNLYNSLKERTVIIITHRLFTHFNFDKIIVLEDGQITEQGTHDELISFNKYYASIYYRQMSGMSIGT